MLKLQSNVTRTFKGEQGGLGVSTEAHTTMTPMKTNNPMKRIAVIAAAVSVAFFSARANDVLQLTEVGEDPALITVTFNGSPLAGVMQTKL